MITLPGSRIYFRDITADDAYTVAQWRNTPEARAAFFDTDVVTPDTHRQFIASRKPHDLVWMICELGEAPYLYPIGMTALTIDTKNHTGEYGRAFIAPECRGQGYAKEQEYLLLWAAFEFFRLDSIWLDAFVSNKAIIGLHRKTGWREVGVNVPGHTHELGPVLHMRYLRDDWHDNRQYYTEQYKVVLPEWR